MLESENTPFSQPGGTTVGSGEQQRLKALSALGLLEAETIPVFEAATQTTADFLEVPICLLGFLDESHLRVRSAVGLSRLGLMNQLATTRVLPRHESFCTHVIENHQVLAINDALSDPVFSKSILVHDYGIRAYLGAPLIDSSGHCLGAIAVMDRSPRTFTIRDIKFLELMACWSMSEFERNWLLKLQVQENIGEEKIEREVVPHPLNLSLPPDPLSTIQVKLELLTQLTQELRTPLTSVLGMASVVSREIYGPLTNKQKEYIEIIQNSGRYLLSLVNEISELGAMDNSTHALNLTSGDIEMLCQQALNVLEEAANRREQQIRLSVEPGPSRIWFLDKDKVRQLLYHLVFSVMQSATTGSIIRIHVSHKDGGLNLAVSVSHPWLGDGLAQVDPYFSQLSLPSKEQGVGQQEKRNGFLPNTFAPLQLNSSEAAQLHSFNRSRESLRLLLSCHLAQLHGGQVSILGTPESGYRYIVSLPALVAADDTV